jgi:hypothetical protein
MSSTSEPRSAAAAGVDTAAIATTVVQRVTAAAPELREAASALLARLPPQRWAIEWNLPTWLGAALRVPADQTDRMTIATVLGLGAVRLRDDLADGDIAPVERPAATALAQHLWEQSIAVDRELFEPSSPYWAYLEKTMAAWDARESRRPDLTNRGAPLKIPALGVCLLADQPDAFAEIASCLDRTVEALALEDDIGDWRADVEAGRWNAFVAHAAPEAPNDDPAHTRSQVLVAMLTTDAIATYVARVVATFELAADDARRLSINPLADHLAAQARFAAQHGASLEAHYHETARRASEMLSGTVR